MLIRRTVLAGLLLISLAACGRQALEDYASETPRLDLREYLSGSLDATGIFFDRTGRAAVRFTVEIDGRWTGDEGTLDERFRYSDGRSETRTWKIRFADDTRFTATAGDTVGEATGAQTGNAATMRYRLRIPREQGEVVVSMEDWFYLQADGTLINRATMRKFGLTVGEVLVVFRKSGP